MRIITSRYIPEQAGSHFTPSYLRMRTQNVCSTTITKVVAYPNHVMRGLEFLQISGHTANTGMVLVSASLQGEVKFWKKHLPKHIHPRNRYSRTGYISEEKDCEKCLLTKVGDHVHYDNIKFLAFTLSGRSLAVSRACDAKIWFQTVWQ